MSELGQRVVLSRTRVSRRAWPVYREAIRRHLAAGLTLPQCRELATLLGQVIKASEVVPLVTG